MDKNLRSKDHSYSTIFKLSKSYSFNTHFDWIPFNIRNCRMYHFTMPLTLGCYQNSDGCNGQISAKVSNLNILDSSLPLKIVCGFIIF
jgi:hypothetical protein